MKKTLMEVFSQQFSYGDYEDILRLVKENLMIIQMNLTLYIFINNFV